VELLLSGGEKSALLNGWRMKRLYCANLKAKQEGMGTKDLRNKFYLSVLSRGKYLAMKNVPGNEKWTGQEEKGLHQRTVGD
jgi:hypothetical protein